MNPNDILIYVQVGAQIVPILATTIDGLKKIFAEQEIDPAIYARIDAAYESRIEQAQREADSHQ